ncbi:MAG: excisionase [Clostridia bacterium]|nr:excisionase [Clostridia bacterium]
MNNTTVNTVPIWEMFLLTPKQASMYTNINKMDEIINNPMCDFVLRIGKKRLVKRKELEKFLEKSIEI